MIQVEVDTISPSEHGLAIGCTVRFGDDGPVRFVKALVPRDLFDPEVRAELLMLFNALATEHYDTEPLF